MDPRLEKVLKLPTKQKIGIMALILVLEAAALVWFLYLPRHKELTALRTQLTTLQGEVAEKQKSPIICRK